jgi:nucleoside-diphosphate-sugar epimerase
METPQPAVSSLVQAKSFNGAAAGRRQQSRTRGEIVVTGAGGFNGPHLVAQLLACGHRVTAAMGCTPGRLNSALQTHPALTLVTGDLRDGLPLPSHVDAVVHAAARSPAPGVSNTQIIHDNVTATARLLEYATEAGARTYIYFSSVSIYGEISEPVVDEGTPIINPNPYGMSKYLCEMMLRDLPAPARSISIRLPGILGPNSVRNWLTRVLAAAKENRDISCYNPEAPFNNAIHVDDLSEFVDQLLLDANWAGHHAVTVGAAGMTSIREAVQIIVWTLRSRSQIRILVEPVQTSFVISSKKAESFGYKPREIESILTQFARDNLD